MSTLTLVSLFFTRCGFPPADRVSSFSPPGLLMFSHVPMDDFFFFICRFSLRAFGLFVTVLLIFFPSPLRPGWYTPTVLCLLSFPFCFSVPPTRNTIVGTVPSVFVPFHSPCARDGGYLKTQLLSPFTPMPHWHFRPRFHIRSVGLFPPFPPPFFFFVFLSGPATVPRAAQRRFALKCG